MKMDQIPIWVLLISILMVFSMVMAEEEEEEVRQALVRFMNKLSPENTERSPNWGWNLTSDPCIAKWNGVICDPQFNSVQKIILQNYSNLNGTLDADSLCMTSSLQVLILRNNNLSGLIPDNIGDCRNLNHLNLRGNMFSGDLPDSLSKLTKLRRLDIADNDFYGELPNLDMIPTLISFLAQNNQLTGPIPDFDFSNLMEFDVSNNNLMGPIPDVNGHFTSDSFSGNPLLCGPPLPYVCPPLASHTKKQSKFSSNQLLIYSGYLVLGLIVLIFLIFKLSRKRNAKQAEEDLGVLNVDVEAALKTSGNKGLAENNRSDYSLASFESQWTSPLILLTTSEVKGLNFDDLLQAPAELIGKGNHGSLYKVMLEDGSALAVKRINDWGVSSEEFERKMNRINQVKHPNVLPMLAYYCSKKEKLLVYEFQENGSLSQLLHGTKNSQAFDWGSRLNVAASIAETLAFMHRELQEDGVAHSNLKSSNILFNHNMEPCISEYGLLAVEDEYLTSFASPINSFTENEFSTSFKVDVYAFGEMLVELVTGKAVEKKGNELGSWVEGVVGEEVREQVFDEMLILEGASEERMMSLLEVAAKCLASSPEERPSISQVAMVLHSIKEDEEKSISFNP